jgi:hypothetical protein
MIKKGAEESDAGRDDEGSGDMLRSRYRKKYYSIFHAPMSAK